MIEHIGEMIREARQYRNMTQAQLAEKLGHHQSGYVSRIETGEKIPGLGVLERIAVELGAHLVVGFEFPERKP